MDPNGLVGTITVVIQLIFLEGILSIDNAAVLGAMVSVLPTDKPTPFPKPLHFMQSFTDRVFGMQQAAALKVGLLGAYFGRGLMLVMAAWVIGNPTLKLLGAAYLVKLAFDHLSKGDMPGEEEEIEHRRKQGNTFWMVVLSVELADLAFSLDNVVAAVALSSQLWVVMLGVFIGIVVMRFAASIFTWMIKKEPILETAAYIVVFNIGAELLINEMTGFEFQAWQKFVISASTLILTVVYAHIKPLHVLGPVWEWIGEGMGTINELLNWILRPFVVLIKVLFSLLASGVRTVLPRRTVVQS